MRKKKRKNKKFNFNKNLLIKTHKTKEIINKMTNLINNNRKMKKIIVSISLTYQKKKEMR